MPRPGDRIGTLLGGKYRLEALLAVGGMGLVYSGRHEHTHRAVAVKLLRPELATRPDLVRRVSAEARLAVEAAHPNVVEVIDAGADEQDVPYLVLERLYGKPLDALIHEPLSLVTTAQAVVPVLNALVRLHAAGIVHRDIKPSNIFMSGRATERVTPKLLDFGIAKALEGSSATQSGIALGTPAYMAPEQALGAARVGPATDVWSIGVVIARCLTGKLPFEGPSSSRIGVLRNGLRPGDLPGVPEPVARVLCAALQFDPEERPRSMSVFRAALLDALSRVSRAERWPNESSVSYAPDECELASALEEEPSAATPGDTPDADVAGRPEHVMTKTLDIETRALAPRRSRFTRRRVLAFALAAGSLLGVYAQRRVNERFVDEHASLPTRALPSPVESTLAPAGVVALDTSAQLLEPPRAAALENEPPSRKKAVPARAARPARRDARDRPTAANPLAANPLGANRSPIIE